MPKWSLWAWANEWTCSAFQIPELVSNLLSYFKLIQTRPWPDLSPLLFGWGWRIGKGICAMAPMVSRQKTSFHSRLSWEGPPKRHRGRRLWEGSDWNYMEYMFASTSRISTNPNGCGASTSEPSDLRREGRQYKICISGEHRQTLWLEAEVRDEGWSEAGCLYQQNLSFGRGFSLVKEIFIGCTVAKNADGSRYFLCHLFEWCLSLCSSEVGRRISPRNQELEFFKVCRVSFVFLAWNISKPSKGKPSIVILEIENCQDVSRQKRHICAWH